MDNITEQSIRAAALEALPGDIDSVRLGEFALAMNAHEAAHTQYAGRIESDEALTDPALSHLLAHFDIAPENESYLCVEWHDGRTDKAVFFFSDENFVMVMDHDAMEPICEMSVRQFFRYMNTLPNILAWADTSKPMINGTPEGLHLLKKLAHLPTDD
ncbi:MAG: hypothetical protein AWU57_193 [Marinobacter sp. T13-3]|nr:MAG: hypothetical protein AWU57_193 [Marinobacter sp. T13-3]